MIRSIEIGDETPIWRYMELPKLLAMLSSKTMWFAKAALFEDGYEGFCKVQRREMPPHDPLSKAVTRTDANGRRQISFTELVVDMARRSAEYFDNARQHLYVNSWCIGDESMAMWQIYGSGGQGVAVKSTVGQYRRAARFNVREEQCAFGPVEYDLDLTSSPDLNLDLREGSVPAPGPGVWERLLRLAFHKRTCFEYEREWRAALYQDRRPDGAGCNIDFDLDQLISSVCVGPRTDAFFADVVAAVMEKFGLSKPLEQSVLLQPPTIIRAESAG